MQVGRMDPSLRALVANCAPPDIIELGVPFTDPIADGPTIQNANTVSPRHGPTPEIFKRLY